MEWTDQGVLLAVRRHGEGSAIVEVMSEFHGRHAGIIRGGGSRKSAALLQPGAQLALKWHARLEEQLGTFSVEQLLSRSAFLLSKRENLYAFNALASMLSKYLPEREPNSGIYFALIDLLENMDLSNKWQHRFCYFELKLLEALGYGLDLSACAVTGQGTDLAYVSPKSGRAVCRAAAKGWEERLLALPPFLHERDFTDISQSDFRAALTLTGFFFQNRIPETGHKLPVSRLRFADMV